MTQQRISFLGLPLDVGYSIADLTALLTKKGDGKLVTFVRADAWAFAAKHPEFTEQLGKMDLVIPASFDIAYSAQQLHDTACTDVCFETHSLAAPFFKAAIEQHISVMLVGGQPAIDERVHDKLTAAYPGLNIPTTANGYGDIAPKIALILEKNPDVVLVDYAAGKAENFLIALKDAGYKGVAIAVTGFFDETLLDTEFYPEWAKKWNVQYTYRLLSQPGTLLSGFIGAYPSFAIPAVKALADKYKDKYLPKKA